MLKKAFRDRLFIVTTFPIALLAFWVVQLTFFGGGFLPFMAIMLLAILTFSEKYAAFEVKRTNGIMKSRIEAHESPWYSNRFWSWEGVKERLTSTKAWFAIVYVFAAIFFSTLGISILLLFWVSVAVLLFALGIITPSNWNWVYHLNESEISGKLNFLVDPDKVQITFNGIQSIESEIPDKLTWVYTSSWTIGFCFLFILLNFFMIPVIARHLQDIVANLLGANASADSVSSKINEWLQKKARGLSDSQ